MKRISTYIFCLFALVALASACGDEYDTNKDYIDETEQKVMAMTYFASAVPANVEQAFKSRLANITTNPDQASVIVLKSSDLYANTDLVREAWEEGKVVVEFSPETIAHSEFWESIGGPALIVNGESVEDFLLVATQRYGCYTMQDPFVLKGYLSESESDDDDKASATSSDNWKDSDGNTTSPDEEVEYLKSMFDSFVEWLNENALTKNDSGASTIEDYRSELNQYIEDKEYSQVYETSFPIGVDNFKLCKIALSKPDRITRNSDISVKFTITPLYAYEMNGGQSGDYYFVTATIISRNAKMFGTYKKKHGAIPTYAHALYSEDIHWKAELVTGNSNYKVSLFKEPSPETTVGTANYTSSFTAGLNITGQGGITGGNKTGNLTVGGSFTWNNSVSKPMSDQMIMQNSTSDGKVEYNFLCLNFMKDDNAYKAVPLIARSNQPCVASWCWKVSGVKDGETTSFKFKFTLDPTFGYMYRHATWGAEGHLKHNVHVLPEKNRVTTFEITPPDRNKYGIIEITSTDTRHITNVEVFDKNGKSVDYYKSAFSEGEKVKFQLPVGEYSVEYKIRIDQTVIEKRRISNINVETGKTSSYDSYEGQTVI